MILGTVGDLVGNFLYYDRKTDEDLRYGDIQKALQSGEVTIDEIVDTFRNTLIAKTKEK